VTDNAPTPFARHGAEKTIFDARMQPQALYHEGAVTVAYQANPEGLPGHPHITVYDASRGAWTRPHRLGFVHEADHHLAPIVWLDAAGLRHVLYGCHRSPGVHLVQAAPGAVDNWRRVDPIGDDVSFPSVRHIDAHRRVMTHRVGGHLGHWVYRTSDDGVTWSPPRPLIDFNRDPADTIDRHAGCYLTTCAGREPDVLHLGLCRWDDREDVHPHYSIHSASHSRYDLYYLKLNVATGEVTNAAGAPLDTPLTRSSAAAALAIDTGWELTNFPAMSVGPNDRPTLAAPVTDGDPSCCRFQVAYHDGEGWRRGSFGRTDSIWSALMLRVVGLHEVHAYAIVGDAERDVERQGPAAVWGGGDLRRWISFDNGVTWFDKGSMAPDAELLYNNPQPVARSDGGILPHSLVCYGWSGPGGIWDIHDRSRSLNRGRGYLHLFGSWV
jgi:hypothetical protein